MGRPKGSKDKTKRKINIETHHTHPALQRLDPYTKNMKQEEISRIIGESTQYFPRNPVKTNAEMAERLDAYFAECYEKGQIPTVEDMALSLGVTRQTLWNWEREVNKNPERAEMVRRAKEVLAAIDAKLVSEGKIPQVTYIFRSKNYFGMRDQTEHINITIDPLGDSVDTETLRRKALENVYGITDEVVIEAKPEPLLLESPEE